MLLEEEGEVPTSSSYRVPNHLLRHLHRPRLPPPPISLSAASVAPEATSDQLEATSVHPEATSERPGETSGWLVALAPEASTTYHRTSP